MGGSKTKTQQTGTTGYTQANQYGQIVPQETPDIQAARQFQFSIDPRIKQIYGAASRGLAESYASPVGGYYPPQMREAALRSGRERIAGEEAEATSAAQQQLQGQQYAQKIGLASLTAPQIVQTGASGTGTSTASGTTTQSQSLASSLIGGAATVGAAF